jgi:hypothetical protein
MTYKWHVWKEGEAGNEKIQRQNLLGFSTLLSFSSAGSQSVCLHSSLGCKPRSLIRASLGWFEYSKKIVSEGDPTPA